VEEDLTPEMMEGVEVHYAECIDDVLDVALPLVKARPDIHPALSEAQTRAASLEADHQQNYTEGPATSGPSICRYPSYHYRPLQSEPEPDWLPSSASNPVLVLCCAVCTGEILSSVDKQYRDQGR